MLKAKYSDRLVVEFETGQRRGLRINKARCLKREEIRKYVQEGIIPAVKMVRDRLIRENNGERIAGQLSQALTMVNTERFHNRKEYLEKVRLYNPSHYDDSLAV